MIDPALDKVRRLAMTLAAHVHARCHDGTTDADQRLTTTADVITGWLTTDPAQTALVDRINQLEALMTSFGNRMDDTQAAIAELNQATDDLATRIDTIIDTTDVDTAAALAPIRDRLRLLATDPSQPVPPEEPTPDQPV